MERLSLSACASPFRGGYTFRSSISISTSADIKADIEDASHTPPSLRKTFELLRHGPAWYTTENESWPLTLTFSLIGYLLLGVASLK
jgi:hypothetical protein